MQDPTSKATLPIARATDVATGHRRPMSAAQSRAILMLLLSVAAPCTTSAEHGTVHGVTIINAGIYELKLGRSIAARNRTGHAHYAVTAKRLIRRTTDVPAQLCLSFGFEYIVLGAPADAVVPIRMITRFPSSGLRHPESQAIIHHDEVVVTRAIGKVHFRSFTLESPTELVPGLWTLELWHKDRKLAAQSFTLTVPCADCAPDAPLPLFCERPIAAIPSP